MNQFSGRIMSPIVESAHDWFRAVLYSIGDAVVITDREGRVQHMNPEAERLTGWREHEAWGEPLERVFRIVNEETRGEVVNPVQRVLKEGVVVGLADHTLLISREGREWPISDSGAPILDDKGEIWGVVLVFRDETAEREAQKAVREARDFAEAIVATVREPLLVLDGDLRVVSANASFYRVFHVKPDETVGRKVYELGDGQWNIPELRRLLEDILPHNTHFDDFEVAHDFERIGRRVMRLNARRIRRDGEKKPWILLAIEDVTRRKEAEDALRASEATLRGILQVAPVGLGVAQDRVIQWANEAFCEMLGYDESELVGRDVSFLYPTEEEYRRVGEYLYRRVTKGELKELEVQLRHKEGHLVDVWMRVSFLPPEGGARPALVAAADITERKRMEVALRESEERYRSLYENATVGIYRTTPDGRILLANPTLIDMLGFDSFEDLAKRDLQSEGYARPFRREQFIEQIEKHGVVRGRESAWLRKDGSIIWVRESARAIRDATGKTLFYDGVVEDITQRKEAEEQARRRALYMEKLNAVIAAAVTEPDLDSLLETALDELLEALDLRDGVVWVSGRRVIRGLPPHMVNAGFEARRRQLDIPSTLASRDLAAEGVPEPYDPLASMLTTEFGIHAVIVAPIHHPAETSTRLGGLVVCDTNPRSWTAEEIALVEAVGRQLASAAQRLRLIEHLQEVNERLQEALQAQRQIVHNVSHELRTPLSVLMGYAELLESGGLGELKPKQQEAVELIMRYSQELHMLVERLVLMRTLEMRPFREETLDLRAWLLERMRGWRLQARRYKSSLELDLPEGALTLRCDPTLLDELLANLLDNALKFSPEGGLIKLGVRREEDAIHISIADQGVGIPADQMEKIFEPFYQVSRGLKRRFRGLGLGLSLCKEIVERHGGQIWAESEGPDRGATIHVTLPAAAE